MTTTGARCMLAPWQLLITLLFLGAGSGLAGAHAVVIESAPKDKEVLAGTPREAILRFNVKIEQSVARVSLTTGDGRIIPLPALKKYNGQAPDRLVVPLPILRPGDYLLRYKVLSMDGHATSGAIRFSVIGGE